MPLGLCCLDACQLYYIHSYTLGQPLELILKGWARWLHTGHSLGGALATLAAYDIRKQLQASSKQDVEVMCYSFGAPRTGNHAFAADYNHVVPDTWSIINEQACSGWLFARLLASVHMSCFCLPVCVCATQVGQHRHVVASPVPAAYGNNGDVVSMQLVFLLLHPLPAMLLAKCTLTCITSSRDR